MWGASSQRPIGGAAQTPRTLCIHPPPTAKLTPPLGHIRVSRSRGELRMDWNVSDGAGAEVQLRRRMPTTNWTLGDCGPQVSSGLGVIDDIHGSSSGKH